MKYFWSLIVIQLFAFNTVWSQSYKSELASGNQSFGVKNYTKAEQLYRKASAKEKQNTGSLYNKANSIYRMQSMNEAIASYQTALKSAVTKEEKHQVFHNMGNAFMKQKKYGEAVEAYKNALRNNPGDEQTRYNYALAKKMQKENPDQNKDNKDKKDQDKKDQDKKDQDKKDQDKKDQDKKDQDKKDQDKKDQDKKDQDKKDQQDKEGKDGEKPKTNPQQQKQAQSRQQMENMLKALDNHEQGVRERIQGREQKGKPVTSPTTKDW